MEEKIKLKEGTFNIIIIIGIIFLIFALFSNSLIPKENRVYTTGKVIGIEVIERKGKDTVYAEVEYEINGKKYNERMNTLFRLFKKDSVIDIFYDKDDYTKIQNKLVNSLDIIRGIIILTIGIVGRSINGKKGKNKNER